MGLGRMGVAQTRIARYYGTKVVAGIDCDAEAREFFETEFEVKAYAAPGLDYRSRSSDCRLCSRGRSLCIARDGRSYERSDAIYRAWKLRRDARFDSSACELPKKRM